MGTRGEHESEGGDGFFKKILSQAFFSKVQPIVDLSALKELREDHLLSIPPEFDPRKSDGQAHVSFEASDFNAASKFLSRMKFIFLLLKGTKKYLIKGYFYYLLATFTGLLAPILVNRFISLLTSGFHTSQDIWKAVYYAFSLGLTGILTGIFLNQYFYRILNCHQIITNLLNKKIYDHSLKLSLKAQQSNQVGDIVNHMSSDTEAVSDLPNIIGDAVVTFLNITGALLMLFYYLGDSAWIALGLILFLVPFTQIVGKSFFKNADVLMKFKDLRMSLITEATQAIRVVKLFGWQESIKSKIEEVRGKELQFRRKLSYSEVFASMTFNTVSMIVLFSALFFHAWRGEDLNPALVFTCVSLFKILEEYFSSFSNLIHRSTDALVSVSRISNFLNEETINKSSQKFESSAGNVRIELINVDAGYGFDTHHKLLKKINLKIKPGSSVAIIGSVGAGKSSLLHTLLGELTIYNGQILYHSNEQRSVVPNIAYVPQESYILNGSLKENILFGNSLPDQPSESARLREAIWACCLDIDIQQLNDGIDSEIGEKGINLSGGQRQRIGLARAYLKDPGVLLLDDPMSALDFKTEKKLCERLIFGKWKNKTRIIVTHRLEYLDMFDKIILIENGEIIAEGELNWLLAHSIQFYNFYNHHIHSRPSSNEEKSPPGEHFEFNKNMNLNGQNKNSRITVDEDRERGGVNPRLYWDYLKKLTAHSRKKWGLVSLLGMSSLAVMMPILQNLWLAEVATFNSSSASSVIQLSPFSHFLLSIGNGILLKDKILSIGVYGIIGLFGILISFFSQVNWIQRGLIAGQEMHEKMLDCVFGSKIYFFDSNPAGRILQRFSRDIEAVDQYLPYFFRLVVGSFIQILFSLALLILTVPFILLTIIPILYFYNRLQLSYRRPAREVKRMDSIWRSPKYSHFKETLQGLPVIRAYGQEDWFNTQFLNKLAHSQKMTYNHYMLNRWFSTRIPLLGGLISISVGLGLVALFYFGWIQAGLAGVAMVYSLSFWSNLNWGVRYFSDLESRMNSVERIHSFSSLEPEPIFLKQPVSLPSNWPAHGNIEFRDVNLKYSSEGPLILKNVNFIIREGSKVGIVGKTGAGKSTLMQALFRLIEIDSGFILIDGVDIGAIHLMKLRQSMSIVPQDPTLFAGTLRSNLDRFTEFSDDEIEDLLKKSSMWESVIAPLKGLDAEVLEGGRNLSQGQRQLICLARALLHGSKIILMDEATASVDVYTDQLIQKVIRDVFAHTTILIIAHRLETISDCDQIIEIDQGHAYTHSSLDLLFD